VASNLNQIAIIETLAYDTWRLASVVEDTLDDVLVAVRASNREGDSAVDSKCVVKAAPDFLGDLWKRLRVDLLVKGVPNALKR
jgi:hypothetical protein